MQYIYMKDRDGLSAAKQWVCTVVYSIYMEDRYGLSTSKDGLCVVI